MGAQSVWKRSSRLTTQNSGTMPSHTVLIDLGAARPHAKVGNLPAIVTQYTVSITSALRRLLVNEKFDTITTVAFDSTKTYQQVQRVTSRLRELHSGKYEYKLNKLFEGTSPTQKHSTDRGILTGLCDGVEEADKVHPSDGLHEGEKISPTVYLFARVPQNLPTLSKFLRKSIENDDQLPASLEKCELNTTLTRLKERNVRLIWINSSPRRLPLSDYKEYLPTVYSSFEDWLLKFSSSFRMVPLSSLLLDRRLVPGCDIVKAYCNTAGKDQGLGKDPMNTCETDILFQNAQDTKLNLYFRALVTSSSSEDLPCLPKEKSAQKSVILPEQTVQSDSEQGGNDCVQSPSSSDSTQLMDDSRDLWHRNSVWILRALIPNSSVDALHTLEGFQHPAALLTPVRSSAKEHTFREARLWSSQFAGLMLDLSRRNLCAVAEESTTDGSRSSIRGVLIRPVTPLSATLHLVPRNKMKVYLRVCQPKHDAQKWRRSEAICCAPGPELPQAPSKFFQTYLPAVFKPTDHKDISERISGSGEEESGFSLLSELLEESENIFQSSIEGFGLNKPTGVLSKFLASVAGIENTISVGMVKKIPEDRRERGNLLLKKLRDQLVMTEGRRFACSPDSEPAPLSGSESGPDVPLGGVKNRCGPIMTSIKSTLLPLIPLRRRLRASKNQLSVDDDLLKEEHQSTTEKANFCHDAASFPDTKGKPMLVSSPPSPVQYCRQTEDDQLPSNPYVSKEQARTKSPVLPVGVVPDPTFSNPPKSQGKTLFLPTLGTNSSIASSLEKYMAKPETFNINIPLKNTTDKYGDHMRQGVESNIQAFCASLCLLKEENTHSGIQKCIDQCMDTLSSMAHQVAQASVDGSNFDAARSVLTPLQESPIKISSSIQSASNALKNVIDPAKEPFPVSVWRIVMEAFLQATICIFDIRLRRKSRNASSILTCLQAFGSQITTKNNFFQAVFNKYFFSVLGQCLEGNPVKEVEEMTRSLFEHFEIPLPPVRIEEEDAESTSGAIQEGSPLCAQARSCSESSLNQPVTAESQLAVSSSERKQVSKFEKEKKKPQRKPARDPKAIIAEAREKRKTDAGLGRTQFSQQLATVGRLKEKQKLSLRLPKKASSHHKRKHLNVSNTVVAEKLPYAQSPSPRKRQKRRVHPVQEASMIPAQPKDTDTHRPEEKQHCDTPTKSPRKPRVKDVSTDVFIPETPVRKRRKARSSIEDRKGTVEVAAFVLETPDQTPTRRTRQSAKTGISPIKNGMSPLQTPEKKICKGRKPGGKRSSPSKSVSSCGLSPMPKRSPRIAALKTALGSPESSHSKRK